MTGIWTAAQPDENLGQKAYINVRLLDPATGLDVVCDAEGGILTDGETIAEFGAGIFKNGTPEGAEVIDCGGHPPAVWGEKATKSCIQRKLAGVVINGAIRDVANIRAMQFPAFAKLVTPTAGDPKGQGMIDVSIKIGEQYIRTGDWIVGDDDGVVVIPQEKAVEVANRAQAVVEREDREMAEIDEGSTLGKVSELMRWEQKRKRET